VFQAALEKISQKEGVHRELLQKQRVDLFQDLEVTKTKLSSGNQGEE
jgi:hypothetical protein